MRLNRKISELLTKSVQYQHFGRNSLWLNTSATDALHLHRHASIKEKKRLLRDDSPTSEADISPRRHRHGLLIHHPSKLPPEKTGSREDVGLMYLEKIFDYTPKQWINLMHRVNNRDTLMILLTNFQRHIRALRSKELLGLMERMCIKRIRENNEGVDIFHVILCEFAHRFTKGSIRHLSISEISKLCKILAKIKFNKELNKKEAIIPICASNYKNSKVYDACKDCKLRYEDLLIQSGNDLMTILMISFGKSILLQSKDMRKLHENSIIPYLSFVGNKNCTSCSHIVRELCIMYYKCFLSTKSIINIAVLLHTIKRTKARANFAFGAITTRLLKSNTLENICSKEFVTKVQSIAISQIILSCISSEYRPSKGNRLIDDLLYRILIFAEKTYSHLLKYDKHGKYSNFITQISLLHKACSVERYKLNSRIQANPQLYNFINSVSGSAKSFNQTYDFKTSNTHLQVCNIIESFNYKTKVETRINPYTVDIFVESKNLIVEVDGPYHYTTSINHSVNKILNRDLSADLFQHTLNSRLKQRLLQKSGYTFINIPYYQWPQTNAEQTYFIASLGI